MKGFSVKQRVALWYSFSLLAILVLVGALLMAAGDRLILSETTSNLTAVTDRAVGDVWILDGRLTIDEDIAYYGNGAYVVLYQGEETLLSGLVPEGFPDDTPFAADSLRRIRAGKYSFYVYDRLIENPAAGRIWVRGVASARLTDMAPAVIKMMTGVLIVLPLLFLIALAGGWILTRQAFAPLDQIVDTAEEIRKSGELSRRIGLGSKEEPDEVRRTAAVFDEMLDQIQKNFETEKQFTNDASHELRTPLAVILAQSEFALENLEDTEEVRESLTEIRSQAEGMSSLVTQLLTMARADRGIEQLKKRPADISLLAEESAGRFRTEAAARHIRLEVRAEEGCYLSCDPVFMGRMFDNLIDNSLKYGRPGGTTLVEVREQGGVLEVEVTDDGRGISEEDLPHIWERFYRGRRTEAPEAICREDEERSMGLGLPMVRWIAEAHGGEVQAVSTEGKGTRFRITFPLE